MSDTPNRFKHQSLQDAEAIGNYLSALKEGFENGALVFSTNGDRMVLKPQGLVNLELEAKRKGDGVKLSLKFRWTEEANQQVEGDQPLLIKTLKQS
jgi:amphi-Trp domain-containing protein